MALASLVREIWMKVRTVRMRTVPPQRAAQRTEAHSIREIHHTVVPGKDKVLYKAPLTSRMLKEHIQNIKGAIMMCYPMGLPSHDSVQQELKGTCEAKESLNPLTTQLWWAGKELAKERRLCDHVGKNEKTKIIVKLQEKGHGPPQREPPIDAETQKAMMAWYYKQQQEQKKLYEDEDDSYANSEWANPKALKSHFQGTTHIQYR
ncbi:hypothetical protein O6H91_15G077700 [Diphasiastrum complanatum]|uniref:Uncharacterized protein n=1 Tax=Diphasiastrum complanatum TaxID=34168 RepID=A0ACC2BK14_DIPCM|nr:hypothetical protein O6H91_15G077700 [Diphasiastrum complanatum]